MVNKHFKGGHDGIANDAISTLDIALWDLKAKANDEPLWKTLGGVKQPINAYASGLDMPLSDQEIFDFYRSAAEKYGFTDGKLKIGLDQDRDLRRIGLMNDALSINTDEPGLMVDANEYWSPKQAIRKVREMEEQFDLMWIEEPARRWDFLGLRRICDAVKTPVCAGENLDTLGDFLPYFHNRSADIIQVGSGMTGITCALQLADAAYGFNLPVTLGGSAGHHHAHLATVIPNYITIEVGNPEPDDGVTTHDVTFENGKAILGGQTRSRHRNQPRSPRRSQRNQDPTRQRPQPLRTPTRRRPLRSPANPRRDRRIHTRHHRTIRRPTRLLIPITSPS